MAQAGSKPPRKKSGKNIIIIAAALGMMMLLLIIVIFNGADLGESKVQKEAKQKQQQALQKTYAQKIPDPSASTKERLESAQQKVRLQKLKQLQAERERVLGAHPIGANGSFSMPNPPSSIPMPAQAPLNYQRLSDAQARLKKQDQALDSAGGSQAGQGSSGSSFLMYSAGSSGSGKSSLPGLSSLRWPNASQPQGGQGGQGSNSGAAQANAKYQQQIQSETPPPVTASPYPPASSSPHRAPPSDPNAAWLYQVQNSSVKDTSGDIMATRDKALYWLAPGTTINAVVLNAVNTMLPGPIVARVTQNVYDSRYGKYLVIPAGSVLKGQYNSSVQDGQDRVFMAFDTLVTPSGGEVQLGNMSAGDALGRAGVKGVLHTHFWERMGISTLLAFEAIGMDRLSPSTTTVGYGSSTTSPAYTGAQIISNTANQELQRRYSVKPNITIAEGAPMSIITTGGIVVPPLANSR